MDSQHQLIFNHIQCNPDISIEDIKQYARKINITISSAVIIELKRLYKVIKHLHKMQDSVDLYCNKYIRLKHILEDANIPFESFEETDEDPEDGPT